MHHVIPPPTHAHDGSAKPLRLSSTNLRTYPEARGPIPLIYCATTNLRDANAPPPNPNPLFHTPTFALLYCYPTNFSYVVHAKYIRRGTSRSILSLDYPTVPHSEEGCYHQLLTINQSHCRKDPGLEDDDDDDMVPTPTNQIPLAFFENRFALDVLSLKSGLHLIFI